MTSPAAPSNGPVTPAALPAERAAWLVAQWVLVAGGAALIALLLIRPRAGLVALWDVLIPAAPALLVFMPGLWRNICPLGTVSQVGRRARMGPRLRLSAAAHARVSLASMLLLLVLVPARHVGLDDTGIASACLLLAAGVCALAGGFVLDGKSGWCTGLCPVHPVEQLYGSRPAATLKNAHCLVCVRCTDPCPDSTPAMNPAPERAARPRVFAGLVLIGGFPGFVLGWYETPSLEGAGTSAAVLNAFGWPWGMMALSAAVFFALRARLGVDGRATLTRVFAAAAVSLYYWYKLPPLVGLGGGGPALIGLGAALPAWSLWAVRALTSAVFFWWMVPARPRRPARAWLERPPAARPAVPLTVAIPAGGIAP